MTPATQDHAREVLEQVAADLGVTLDPHAEGYWDALETIARALLAEEGAAVRATLDHALNSGDGSYRP